MLIAIGVLFVIIAVLGWALLFAMKAASIYDAIYDELDAQEPYRWRCEDCGWSGDAIDERCAECGAVASLNPDYPTFKEALIQAKNAVEHDELKAVCQCADCRQARIRRSAEWLENRMNFLESGGQS